MKSPKPAALAEITSKIPENRVGGRYLATFSCNSFGIIGKLVAELVAAAFLVAAFGGEYADDRLHIRPKKISG